MTKRKLIALASGLFFFLTTLVLVERSLVKNTLNEQYQLSESKRAAIISRVNLLVVQSDTEKPQGLSSLLQQLNSVSGLVAWQLLNDSNEILSEKSAPIKFKSHPQHLFFYNNIEKKRMMTLKLYFGQQELQSSTLETSEILLLIISVIVLFSLLYFVYRPWLKMEKYAHYLIGNNNEPKRLTLSQISNPIYQVINQLLLKNSLLAKDKVDLTEQVRKISYVDDVTGLGNQLFFKAEFQVRLHNQEEDESGLLVLLSFIDELDIDTANGAKIETQEKFFNEESLRSIATLLRSFTREIPHALVARLRGNDFALLLPNQTRDKTDHICKTLIQQLDKSIFDRTSIKEHFVDIGISAYKQGFDYTKIIAEADMALRNSQLQGGNNWFMYGEVLPDNKVRGLMRWRSFLERILDKRQLLLYGQKIHLFDDDSVLFREVLARIEDGKEILSADNFLPMAHQCGLATEFDRQVIDGVIKHCLYQEKNERRLMFSINLFISSLLDESFVGWLIAKLSSYPELASQITFELNESQINLHLSSIRSVMHQLAQLGVRWCIEHFGSPDEDIAFLDVLPIRAVKIDRRIVYNIHQNRAQQLLLKSLLINLRSRQIQVYAEGVELDEDAEFLKVAGLVGAQGFLFSKPVRMKAVEGYLKAV